MPRIQNNSGAITAGIAARVTAKATVLAAQDVAFPANTYDNGVSGVGATLTADVNGAFPAVDGVAIPTGARILVLLEGVGNAYFDLTDPGSVSTQWVLTRSNDADIAGEIDNNSNVWVSQGTLYADQIFTLINDGPIVIGTTVLDFRIPSSSLQGLAQAGVHKS